MKSFLNVNSVALLVLQIIGAVSLANSQVQQKNLPLNGSSGTGYHYVSANEILSPQAFKGWEDKFGYVTMRIDLNQVRQVQVQCADKELFPTHADQSTKQYHVFDIGRYDVTKLNRDDEACKMGSKYKNAKGVFYCMVPDTMETAVISDTFRDKCGNFYRGYWRVTFKTSDESMGTLFSKGRTMYLRPGAEYSGDFIMGGTYSLKESDFMFLSAVFKTDIQKINEAFQRNQTSYLRYNTSTLLFEEIKSSK